MYSSLDRVDIVVGEQEVFVQTDHRTAEEINEEPEISTLFALTRTLAPKRMDGAENTAIRYVCMNAPPPMLLRVLAATGAQLEAEGNETPVAVEGPVPTAAELADEAFAGLAKRVLEREGLSLDEDALAELESLLGDIDPEDEDEGGEIPYWTAVAELAAVTGELLRARFGGRWVDDEHDITTIPFLFSPGDGQLLNPTGKAEKFMRDGEAESPRHLLTMAADAGSEAGPLLLTLKPHDWPMADTSVCQSMMADAPNWDKVGPVPWVAFGEDHPSTFAIFQKDGEKEHQIDALRAEAINNLADQEVEIEKLDVGDKLEMMVVHGSYFAAEKILDPVFMTALQRQLGAELLAVGVPCKGRMFVTNATQAMDLMGGFMHIIQAEYDKEAPARKLSPMPFLVQDGKVIGAVRPGGPDAEAPEPEPQPKKKGFWKRLFN